MAEAEQRTWRALRPGTVDVDGEPHVVAVVDCGELFLPSGRLVAADPFAMLSRENDYYAVPPGRYPVRVTVDETLQREMYVSLLLSGESEARRAPLIPYHTDGQPYPPLEPEEEYGIPVDAGTVCFVDDEAVRRGMPAEESDWYETVFENDSDDCWFNQIDADAPLPAGLANIPLPLAADGSNIIISHSGWGDGFYAVIGGYDAQGRLVAVHIDLRLHDAIADGEEAADDD